MFSPAVRIALVLLLASSISVFAAGCGGGGGGGGGGTPPVTPTDAYEPNNTIGAAPDIATGSHGSLVNDGADFYRVTLDRTGGWTVAVLFDTAAGNLDLYVYDGVQNLIGASATASPSESVALTVEEAGLYYVEVRRTTAASVWYTLSLGEPVAAYDEWTIARGGTGVDLADAVAADGGGNVYYAGNYSGAIDFDPTGGILSSVSAGGTDCFLVKMNANGTFGDAWAFGGAGDDAITGLAVDAADNVFASGFFAGEFDFDSSAGTDIHASGGGADGFVTKINSNGTYGWTKTFPGGGDDFAWAVATAPSGAIVVCGAFSFSVDLDPGAGGAFATSSGAEDGFLVKLDPVGTYAWGFSIGGIENDTATACATSSTGQVYVGGSFRNLVDFDPGLGMAPVVSSGGSDMFYSGFTSAGVFTGVVTAGAAGEEHLWSLRTDAEDNLYYAGYFSTSFDIDPGAGVDTVTSAGGTDGFIAKVDSAGVHDWSCTFGAPGNDFIRGIGVDGAGGVLATGVYQGTVDFDPGAGTANLTSAGGDDAFALRLDDDGLFAWCETLGGASSDLGYAVAADGFGNAFACGAFAGTVEFGTGGETDERTSAGNYDAYVKKFVSSEWTWTAGGGNADAANAVAVFRDRVVAAGVFSDATVDFDPIAQGGGGDSLTSTAGPDCWVTEIVSIEREVKTYGGTGIVVAAGAQSYNGAAFDSAGNLYAVGRFTGTADFDTTGGVDNHVSSGSGDIFITKTDADGSYGWTIRIGAAGDDGATGVAVDSNDDIYVTGYFSLAVDFDWTAGVGLQGPATGTAAFVLKITAGAAYGWSVLLDGNGDDAGNGLAVDSLNNVYVGGVFSQTVDFDPWGPADMRTSAGGDDGFLVKLGPNGAYGFARVFGGGEDDAAAGVALGAGDFVYVAGSFRDICDFDAAGAGDDRTSEGAEDIFLTSVTANNVYRFTATAGGVDSDAAAGIALDAAGDAYICGSFEGAADFDDSANEDIWASIGLSDGFVSKFSSGGAYGWTHPFGDAGADAAACIVVSPAGHIYFAGTFSSTVDFGTEGVLDNRTAAGGTDFFLKRLRTYRH